VATLTHPKTHRQVTVPEETVGFYLESGWQRSGVAAPASEVPAGTPDDSWKNADILKYAEERSIDLGDAKKKSDLLKVIGKAERDGTDAGEVAAVPSDSDS
jgi:hypothetical protein